MVLRYALYCIGKGSCVGLVRDLFGTIALHGLHGLVLIAKKRVFKQLPRRRPLFGLPPQHAPHKVNQTYPLLFMPRLKLFNLI